MIKEFDATQLNMALWSRTWVNKRMFVVDKSELGHMLKQSYLSELFNNLFRLKFKTSFSLWPRIPKKKN